MEVTDRVGVVLKHQCRRLAARSYGGEFEVYQCPSSAYEISLEGGNNKVTRISGIWCYRHRAAQGARSIVWWCVGLYDRWVVSDLQVI